MQSFEGNGSVPGNNQITLHFKLFSALNGDQINDDSVIYLGSHNFAQAAWGKQARTDESHNGFNYEPGLLYCLQNGSTKNP